MSEQHEQHGQPAVFLDRDGTLMEEVEYCNDPQKVRLFPGVREALAKLKAAGYKNVIITNQSGIARGLIAPEQYEAVHAMLLNLLGDGNIEAAYFCPDFSERRKPSPAMVHEAARDLDLDLARSFFIGDKSSDIECGRNAGVRTILVQTGYGKAQANCEPDFIAQNFAAAADHILEQAVV
jgi:D-glycero-D-manno-heptose 1,7-bisphosphate phosphatase